MGEGNIILSGPPGSGKSTLAAKLAPLIGFSILEKDSIKEILADQIGFGTPEKHQFLKDVSFSIMARIMSESSNIIAIANYPEYFVSCLETNSVFAEIHCECSIETCQKRFANREHRHDVHPSIMLTDEAILPYCKPLGIGPVFFVNTEQIVDKGNIVTWLRTLQNT